VAILVGLPVDEDVASRQFTIPKDLLKRRSGRFEIMLDNPFLGSNTRTIKVPEISIATFRSFYIWTLSSTPQIDPTVSLEALVNLAIFATLYQVTALQNQAVDHIRACLSSGDWQLQPGVVKRIYEHVGETSTLRQMVRVGLGTINQSINQQDLYGYTQELLPADDFIQSWRELFRNTAGDLGADYFEATQRKWDKTELQKGGPCRFHEHGGRPVPQSDSTYNDEINEPAVCPYAAAECFNDEVEPPTSREHEVLIMRESKKKKRVRAKALEEEACKPEIGSAEEVAGDDEVKGRWSRVSVGDHEVNGRWSRVSDPPPE
jgi:hypothetical protein